MNHLSQVTIELVLSAARLQLEQVAQITLALKADNERLRALKEEPAPVDINVTWNCRVHPKDSWHEVGCPHKMWSASELHAAIVSQKKFQQSASEFAQQFMQSGQLIAPKDQNVTVLL